MRNRSAAGAALVAAVLLAGCAHRSGFDRARPDEFAVARQAPLVIPPDFALQPPQAGATPARDTNSEQQTLDALFGGTAPRSAAETAVTDEAGATSAEVGIRSSVGDPQTKVVDKGSTTRDIVAAPASTGQDARAQTGQ